MTGFSSITVSLERKSQGVMLPFTDRLVTETVWAKNVESYKSDHYDLFKMSAGRRQQYIVTPRG
jgi:hypothetical protein